MDKRIAILKELLERTKKRKANWIPTNIVDQYSLELGSGKIALDYNRPQEGYAAPYVPDYEYLATFYNSKGTVIESISVDFGDKDNEIYNLLNNLWNEIEDAYLGKNETLDSMMVALGLSK